jgi:hypothetical protein
MGLIKIGSIKAKSQLGAMWKLANQMLSRLDDRQYSKFIKQGF